ncbi:hypothetical protein P3T23_008852 [Paraburkholderia sp. GAS448]
MQWKHAHDWLVPSSRTPRQWATASSPASWPQRTNTLSRGRPTQLLLDAIARRGQTEREKNPTILLASHHRVWRIAVRRFSNRVLLCGSYRGPPDTLRAARPFAKTPSVPGIASARKSRRHQQERYMTPPAPPHGFSTPTIFRRRKSNPALDSRGKSLQTLSAVPCRSLCESTCPLSRTVVGDPQPSLDPATLRWQLPGHNGHSLGHVGDGCLVRIQPVDPT